jgi:hypothetical protein
VSNEPTAKMFRGERDVSVAGWTTHEYGRRNQDDNPTVTDFRLDLGHEEKALKKQGGVTSYSCTPGYKAVCCDRSAKRFAQDDGFVAGLKYSWLNCAASFLIAEFSRVTSPASRLCRAISAAMERARIF